jgi:NAD(P)-dependent dehydrogenase (short-subunit alcohol dehydrogenase family)
MIHWREKTFKDKVVLITGASRGIGLTTAIFYARAGAHLVLVSRYQSALEKSKEAVLEEYPDARVLIVAADVTDPMRTKFVLNATIETYGRLDILIANAGFVTPTDQCMSKSKLERTSLLNLRLVLGQKDVMTWWYTQEVNVRGVLNYVQCVSFAQKRVVILVTHDFSVALPELAKTQGQIIIVTSAGAHLRMPKSSDYQVRHFHFST